MTHPVRHGFNNLSDSHSICVTIFCYAVCKHRVQHEIDMGAVEPGMGAAMREKHVVVIVGSSEEVQVIIVIDLHLATMV